MLVDLGTLSCRTRWISDTCRVRDQIKWQAHQTKLPIESVIPHATHQAAKRISVNRSRCTSEFGQPDAQMLP